MISQPELGEKICELRKRKGLTQEELVERCNLNVRTLQRIESGEVIPRNTTIRLIFETLEINPTNYFENTLDDNEEINTKWYNQLYVRFIDLFNLRTSAFKKLTILIVLLSTIIIAIYFLNKALNTQNNPPQIQRSTGT